MYMKKWCFFLQIAALLLLSLHAKAQYINFWDPGLNIATVNTSYLTRNIGSSFNPISYGACLFPDAVGNPPNYDFPSSCPTNTTGKRTWPGNLDLSWNQNGNFGASNYWVLDLNVEPALKSGCTVAPIGPPSLSGQITSPGSGPFSFTAMKNSFPGENFYRAHLIGWWGHACPPDIGYISYMSIGAQDNRGNGKPVGFVSTLPPVYGPTYLHFTARVWEFYATQPEAPGAPHGSAFRLVLLSEWNNIPRMVMINLLYDNLQDDGAVFRWNWPIIEAMYYPGAEVVFADADKMYTYCPGSINFDTQIPVGVDRNYVVNVANVFQCLSNRGIFSNPIPTGNVYLRGAHWAIEGAGDGAMWVSVHGMRMQNY